MHSCSWHKWFKVALSPHGAHERDMAEGYRTVKGAVLGPLGHGKGIQHNVVIHQLNPWYSQKKRCTRHYDSYLNGDRTLEPWEILALVTSLGNTCLGQRPLYGDICKATEVT